MAEASESIDSHVLRKYEVGQKVGKGVCTSPITIAVSDCVSLQAYGIVWKAVDKQSKKTVALKKIFDAFQNSTDAQRTFRVCFSCISLIDSNLVTHIVPLFQEIMFLQEMNAGHHENIIRLLNVLKADNDKDIYLVFEYMGLLPLPLSIL